MMPVSQQDADAELTHDELVVISDVLRRVRDAIESNGQELLAHLAAFTFGPALDTAIAKVGAAAMATRPGQS